jgi:hypothetical protein
LTVAVAPSAARTTADRAMNRTPTRSCPGPGSAGGGSTGRIRASASAEPRNDTALSSTAPGAVSSATSSPARLCPPTNDIARLPLSSELAGTYRSAGTIETNSVAYATENSVSKVPIANATA